MDIHFCGIRKSKLVNSFSSADREFREKTDCEPKSSETRSDEKPSSSKSAGSTTNNQNDKLGVLSLDCLICVKRKVNLDEVKKHEPRSSS